MVLVISKSINGHFGLTTHKDVEFSFCAKWRYNLVYEMPTQV